ncbi:MAG TPA: hypothetical protein VF193_10690 [Steroidobacter sp.]
MKTFAIVCFAAALCARSAMADEPADRDDAKRQIETPQDVALVFEALDRNDDQRISKAEAAQRKDLRRRFAAVDADQDGYLTKAEFAARPSEEPFE